MNMKGDDMTNAVSTETRAAGAAAKPQISVGGQIAALVPQDLDQAYRLSEALARAGDMVPETYRNQPMKIMAAIVKGMEVGLAPMQALASIAVINGRPAIWGDALRALVLRAGHMIDCEIEGEGDRAVAVATLTRANGKKVVRRFSMTDAARAGLAKKPGPWTQYPLRMLMNRAIAFAVRDGAADALMGLQVADEVADYGPDRARDVTPRIPPKGGVIYADPDPVDEIHEGEAAEVLDPTPSPEDIARAEAEALAAARRQGDLYADQSLPVEDWK